jgi:hypothetical protein
VRLITAHRILITAGIVFFAFYGGLRVRHYFTGSGVTADLLHAAVSLMVTVLLILYYRTLRRWGGPG